MKKLLFLFLGFFIACSSAKKNINSNEYTTENDTISNYILFDYINLLTEDDYYSLLDSVKKEISDDFFSLRMAYIKTKIYDPYDVKIDEQRKKIKLNIEEKKFEEALEIAKLILEKRYIDIKTHSYCSYIYAQRGDSVRSNYHNNIYNGLMKSIYFSGDGESVKTAFIVIEISEEYDLLNWLELKPPFGLSPIIKDGYRFDKVKVINENRETELFFNIELALRRFSEEFD